MCTHIKLIVYCVEECRKIVFTTYTERLRITCELISSSSLPHESFPIRSSYDRKRKAFFKAIFIPYE